MTVWKPRITISAQGVHRILRAILASANRLSLHQHGRTTGTASAMVTRRSLTKGHLRLGTRILG
jgi:hypothetical protein